MLRVIIYTTLVVYLISTTFVGAHTHLTNIIINGNKQAVDKCVRKVSHLPSHPVPNMNSPLMRCRNAEMNMCKTKTCAVKAGEPFSVEWHHYNLTKSDNIISVSHHGPCTIYLAPLSSMPKGDVWFKIYEKGFNKDNGLWCTDEVRNAHGVLSFTIPKDITDGKYLLRTEMIALHKARKLNGAQFFPNCVQISVTGSNNKFLTPGPTRVSFPGAYKPRDKGILYNLGKDKGQNYVMPGPPIYPPTSDK